MRATTVKSKAILPCCVAGMLLFVAWIAGALLHTPVASSVIPASDAVQIQLISDDVPGDGWDLSPHQALLDARVVIGRLYYGYPAQETVPAAKYDAIEFSWLNALLSFAVASLICSLSILRRLVVMLMIDAVVPKIQLCCQFFLFRFTQSLPR